MNKRAFTLIELAAVIVVMGVLAASAILSLGHVADAHRFDAMCQEIDRADGLIRSAARQSGQPQQLVFDLDRGEVLWQSANQEPVRLLRLASQDSIEFRINEQTVYNRQVTINCSPTGYTPSYAVGLGRSGENERWLIVAGLTGRTLWTDNEKKMDAIFQSLATHGLAASSGNDVD